MKRLSVPLALALLIGGPALAQEAKTAPQAGAPAPDWLKPAQAQASYLIGMQVGAQLRGEGVAVDPEALNKGIADGLANAASQLSEAQMREATSRLQAEIQAHRQAALAQAADANRAAGAAFLKANAAKQNVVTLPSGLQYEVLSAGKGPKPKATDVVVCNYRGALIDGTEFDSSYRRGTPATMPLKDMIKGWGEALPLMATGSKWRIYVPSDLAYGERGAGSVIGPNAVLVFDIELLSIQAG
jgi:FKBP-type peptidyl-prolyl cis-trans isomerase FklB